MRNFEIGLLRRALGALNKYKNQVPWNFSPPGGFTRIINPLVVNSNSIMASSDANKEQKYFKYTSHEIRLWAYSAKKVAF